MFNKYWDTWMPAAKVTRNSSESLPINEMVAKEYHSASNSSDSLPITDPLNSSNLLPVNSSKKRLNSSTSGVGNSSNLLPTKERKKYIQKKEEKESTRVFGEFKNVNLSPADHQRLVAFYGAQGAADWIEELSLAKASKGIKTKSDYATIRRWEYREAKRKRESAPGLQKGGTGGTHGANQRHTEKSRVHTTAELERSIERFPRAKGMPEV
jgi:hypothetical protein